jgi:LmbE family N-acetylglucosaminyl deacetylase
VSSVWGEVDPAELTRIVVVSPHLDDAALGAAGLLGAHPGSVVVTVCAGAPDVYPDPPTEWDRRGGFVAGDDVLALRREEDRAGLAVLGATPVWLDDVDWQYLDEADRRSASEVAEMLDEALGPLEPTAVFLPMGLANPDHDRTFEAGRIVRDRRPDVSWFAYEDAGYKHIPGLLAWRISNLFRAGLWPTPAVVPTESDPARKRAAIACYRSQVGPLAQDNGLDAQLDAHVPEQFWRLAPPPPGWEALIDL